MFIKNRFDSIIIKIMWNNTKLLKDNSIININKFNTVIKIFYSYFQFFLNFININLCNINNFYLKIIKFLKIKFLI